MSLFIDLRIGDERVGDIKVSRLDVDNGKSPDAVNTYRWYYSRGNNEASGLIDHRYGDGAVALAYKVLGQIAHVHTIAFDAVTVEARDPVGKFQQAVERTRAMREADEKFQKAVEDARAVHEADAGWRAPVDWFKGRRANEGDRHD